MTANDILLGVVIGAQGLKGEVRVKTFTETPAALTRYGDLHTKDGRKFAVASSRPVKESEAILALKGVSDRNAAEALKGTELFVPRGALPAVDEEEFYHADLIGLEAYDVEDRLIGTVKAIHNYGAGDVLEIAIPDGNDLLLAFTRETVPVVDVKNRRMTVAVPQDDEAERQHGVE
ncbi:MAG TPA: ribosome maturation factor RimM [Rhizomicrobium sp.]|nr:ribosome maturation factor RimM [Rhizomicrobium sp.]